MRQCRHRAAWAFRLPPVSAAIMLCVGTLDAQVAAFSAQPAIVDAGGFYDMRYGFTVGPGGFARGGGVRIEIPVAYAETESLLWSAPQTDSPWAPGYVSATASRGATPRMRIAGLLRGIIEAEFTEAVPPGARITINYRGQVQGIAGDVDARFQSRASGTAAWTTPDRVPRITVRPARAELVSASYPSDIVRDTPFALVLVVLDRYGNLATGYTGAVSLRSTDASARLPDSVTFRAVDRGRVVIPDAVLRTAGFQKITASDRAARLATTFKYAMVSDTAPSLLHLFGDTHFHSGTGAESRGFFTASGGADVNTTGTNTFKALNLAGDHRANFTRAGEAYTYARDVMHLDFASTSEHSAPLLTPAAWRGSQDVSDQFNAPGRFTTFYGFEWTPDLNHYVVMYRDRAGMPIGHDSLPDFPALARALERQRVPALAIPHVSWPFRAHNIWQDSAGGTVRRIGELYSLWNSRHLVQPDDEPQLFELGADDPWSYQYAWKRGHRIGVIAASDNHLGHPGANNTSIHVRHSGGLAGVLAHTNDRETLWNAMTGRATYATTGTQIYLDFTSDGHAMGSEYRTGNPPHLAGRVAGTNRLARVEVVRLAAGSYSTVYSARPDGETFHFDFVDTSADGPVMYYLRVTQVEEYPGRLYSHSTAEMAWSSPIWVDRR
jgi:Protein of unknown function (DUF3604)